MTALIAPGRDSVGAALRFVRLQWRRIGLIAAVAAAATAAINLASLGTNAAGLPLSIVIALLSTLIPCGIYAALLGVSLAPAAPQSALVANTGRVWGAMLIVGFMMFLAMCTIALPISVVLAPYLEPYAQQIVAVHGDQAAFMALLERFAEQQPGVFLIIFLVVSAAWLLLSSRLFLAAPASIDAKRIQTFETWPWTKNHMLRIAVARIVLLGPALVFAQALSILSARALGFNMLEGGDIAAFAAHNPAGFTAFSFAIQFVTVAVYNSLEAGLAASFYQALKPVTPPKPF